MFGLYATYAITILARKYLVMFYKHFQIFIRALSRNVLYKDMHTFLKLKKKTKTV